MFRYARPNLLVHKQKGNCHISLIYYQYFKEFLDIHGDESFLAVFHVRCVLWHHLPPQSRKFPTVDAVLPYVL